MIKHILSNGKQIKDITGHVVKNEAIYLTIKRMNERRATSEQVRPRVKIG